MRTDPRPFGTGAAEVPVERFVGERQRERVQLEIEVVVPVEDMGSPGDDGAPMGVPGGAERRSSIWPSVCEGFPRSADGSDPLGSR